MMDSKGLMTISILTLILLGVVSGMMHQEADYYMNGSTGVNEPSEVWKGENWKFPKATPGEAQ